MTDRVSQYQGRDEIDEDSIQYYLDHDLETYIRPVVEPVFHQILSCVDRSDKDVLPFFECANSKVESLTRRSILYVLSHPNQRETNKEYVKSMIIYPSLMDCIHNGEELGQDTSKWPAILKCIMGNCEQYIDLLINLMSMGQKPREKSSSKSKRMSGHMGRRSPRGDRVSPRRDRVSPRRHAGVSPNRAIRVSPRGVHRSPRRLPKGSPRRMVRLSPRSFRTSLYSTMNKK